MRVLTSNVPLTGHFLPLLPLLPGVSEAGAHCCFVSAATMASTVEAEAFEFIPGGPAVDETIAEVTRRTGLNLLTHGPPARVAGVFAGARVDMSGARHDDRRDSAGRRPEGGAGIAVVHHDGHSAEQLPGGHEGDRFAPARLAFEVVGQDASRCGDLVHLQGAQGLEQRGKRGCRPGDVAETDKYTGRVVGALMGSGRSATRAWGGSAPPRCRLEDRCPAASGLQLPAEPAFTAAAHRQRGEIAAMPSASQVAEHATLRDQAAARAQHPRHAHGTNSGMGTHHTLTM